MILNINSVPVKVEVTYGSKNSRTYHACFGEISARITKSYGLTRLEQDLNKIFTYNKVSKYCRAPFIDGDYAYIFGEVERVYPKKYTNTIDDIYLLKKGKKVSCKKYFLQVITERVRYFEKVMNLPPHQVKVKHLSAVLGSNRVRAKLLTFNEKLVHFDIYLIDSVIIHELCHDYYQNHSKEFYSKVLEYCFDYYQKREKLINGVRK